MHPSPPAAPRRRLAHVTLLGLVAALASTGACSLINSFDDVNQGAGGGSTSSSTTSSSSGSGGGPTTSSTGSTTTSTGGASTSSSGSGGAATGGGGTAPVHHALLAVSATDAAHNRVLAVLDAATGDELSREDTIAPAAIVYDPLTSVWYVFDADNFPPLPTHAMTLRAGRIDDTTGKWTELTSVTDAPVLLTSTAGALNGRLVYRAYDPTNSSTTGLAYLDTTHVTDATPAGPSASAWGNFQAETTFNGFIATAKDAAVGGQVTLVRVPLPCATAPCDASRTVITVSSNGGLPPTSATAHLEDIPPAPNQGVVSIASMLERHGGPLDVFIFPDVTEAPADTPPSHTIIRRINGSGTVLGDVRLPIGSARQYVGAVVAECDSVVIASELNKQQAYAIPLDNTGTVAVLSLGGRQATSSIVFEPITKRAFMPFRGTTPLLGAFQLAGTALVPTLAELSGAGIWSPPADLSVDLVVAAQPQTVTCP